LDAGTWFGTFGGGEERKGGFGITSEREEIQRCSQQRPFQSSFPWFSGPYDIVSRKNDTIVWRDDRFSLQWTGIGFPIARKMRAAALIQRRIGQDRDLRLSRDEMPGNRSDTLGDSRDLPQ
jgi:hypothetical protein